MMNTAESVLHGHASGVNKKSESTSSPKWAALIDDTLVSSPQRKVRSSVLIAQSGIDPDKVLVRDHRGGSDVLVSNADVLDLAQGNVFRSVRKCDSPGHCDSNSPPKLALFLNDRAEITMNPNQTGASIRELFSVSDDLDLFRDHESPNDDLIKAMDPAPFNNGPVFRTLRNQRSLKIIVNSKPFFENDGVTSKMTGRNIALLITENPDCSEVFRLRANEPVPVPLDEEIAIEECDQFRVIRNNVAGGFEVSRLNRELGILRVGGLTVELIQQPLPAVIYRQLPTRTGYPHVQQTDVLVRIPGGYPGAMIDGAYLPEASPLLGKVAGQPQSGLQAAGLKWKLVSYHPHKGGGGPPWNKDRHGFHTYVDEILTWIHHARE